MGSTARQQTGVIALTLGMIMLSGCTSSPPNSTAGSPTASVEETPTAQPPADLSFEGGAALSGGDWEAEWDESLASNPGFSVVALDEGSGFWSYADDATECQIQFMNGPSDAAGADQDDRIVSDELLVEAIVSPGGDVTREEVLENAQDYAIAQSPGPGTVAIRTIGGTTFTGETWLRAARVFTTLGGVVYIGINCPAGQDATVEFEKLVETDVAIAVQTTEAG